MKSYIIYGAYGNPQENWFPWLKEELNAVVPKFPTPKNQSLENWLKILDSFEEDSIVIGHSLGVPFILNLLEKSKVKAAFFVAGFVSELGNDKFDKINESFYLDFNWDKIKKNCKKFYIFHSDNDPYVHLEKAEELQEKLNGELIIVPKAGHFNEAAGYDKFELLLEKIKSIL
jgi:predicted alpha/beta hydrolase family esterase